MSNFFADKRNYNNFLDRKFELYKLQVEEEELRLKLQEVTSKLKKCKEDLTPQMLNIKEEEKNTFTLGMESKINMIKLEEELANCEDEKRIKPKNRYAIQCFHYLIKNCYYPKCNLNIPEKKEINTLVDFLFKNPSPLLFQIQECGFKNETIVALSHLKIIKDFNFRIMKSLNGIPIQKNINFLQECLTFNNKYKINIFNDPIIEYEFNY